MVPMTTPIDPAGQSAGTGAPSGADGSTSNTGTPTTADASTGAQSGTTDSQAAATVSRADFLQIQNQLRAADQRRDAAEKEAQKLKDAQLSDAERQTKELNETKATNQQLLNQIKDLRIQNAFVTDNTHDWHDARAALKLADLSGVTIDDEGTVKGLKEALEAVAKSSPYLLKPKAETEGNTGTGTTTTQQTGVTGVAGGGNGTNATDKNALARKFPQLAGRVSQGN
jgi:hypothetical protein